MPNKSSNKPFNPFLRAFLLFAFYLFLGMGLLYADFYSKAVCYQLLPSAEIPLYPYHKEMAVFQDFLGIDFYITLTMNKGAAWGLFSAFQLPLLCLRSLVVIALLVYLLFFLKERHKTLPFFFIIVGALGNIVDFFLYGSVVDFLHFNFWGYHFPVFNLADSFITIGVISLLLLTASDRQRMRNRTSCVINRAS